MSRRSFSSKNRQVALGGILAAGSIVLLWFACLAPSGRMGLTAVAGLFPMAAVLSAGRTAGYLCWAAAGLIGLLILPDKGVPLLYLVFLGLSPVVKSRIESIRSLPVEWCLKLLCFNLALTLFWVLLRGLFLPNPPVWLQNNGVLLYGAGNLVFVLYDIGLSRLIALLQARTGRGRRG